MTDVRCIQNPEYEEPKILWPHITGNGGQHEMIDDETTNSSRFNCRGLFNVMRRSLSPMRRCGLYATFAIIFSLCLIHSVFIIIAYQKLGRIESFLHIANSTSKAPFVFCKGSVVDAESGFNMSNVTIVAALSSNISHLLGIVEAKSLHNGEFRLFLAANSTYDLSFKHVGYRTVDISHMMNISRMNQEISLPPVLMINNRFEGTGMAGGQVVDRNTSKPEGNVRVAFRDGLQNTTGSIVGTTTTGANGVWEVHLKTGHYTAVFDKSGFASAITSVTVLGGLQRGNHYTTLSRNFVDCKAQFVLEWTSSSCNLEPMLYDQDGHITTTQVCQRQETNGPFAPACLRKTTVLDEQLPGTYRYVVKAAKRQVATTTTSTSTTTESMEAHAWSEDEGAEITELRRKRSWYEPDFQFDWSECGAEVKIFIDGVLRGSYLMPYRTGKRWTVAEVNGDQLVFVNSVD